MTDDAARSDPSDRLLSPLPVGAVVTLQEHEHPEAPWVVDGRLASAGTRGLGVELLGGKGVGGFPVGAGVRLSCGTEAGLYLANTSVVGHDDDVVHLDTPASSRFVQRRRHPRVPVRLSMSCRRLVAGSADAVEVLAVDLSEGGVRIVAPAGIQVGEVVLLTVADGTDAIGHRGTVVDVREVADAPGTRHARVAFGSSNPATEAALHQLLQRHSQPTG